MTQREIPVDDNSISAFNEIVLKKTNNLPDSVTDKIIGYDFNNGIDYDAMFSSYYFTGIQATAFSRAENVINNMIHRRNILLTSDEDIEASQRIQDLHPFHKSSNNCTIFLGYTSNMVSSGVRETIRYLAEHNLVDVLVTSAGGVEEDFIKCMGSFYVGDFDKWSGTTLRNMGVNRIGNILVPNDNYVKFEQWLMPILDQLLIEQTEQNVNWTPSKLIHRLGKEINNPESIYYWCYINKIPVFCPALTDGSLGDILFSHSFKSPGLRIDVIEDIRNINLIAMRARSSGMIVLGGGSSKHHTFNANLMRNGADYCVLINTGQEFDASDSGARPDEAVSWGKVMGAAESIKIYADASLIFPILVARTFAKQNQKIID